MLSLLYPGDYRGLYRPVQQFEEFALWWISPAGGDLDTRFTYRRCPPRHRLSTRSCSRLARHRNRTGPQGLTGLGWCICVECSHGLSAKFLYVQLVARSTGHEAILQVLPVLVMTAILESKVGGILRPATWFETRTVNCIHQRRRLGEITVQRVSRLAYKWLCIPV